MTSSKWESSNCYVQPVQRQIGTKSVSRAMNLWTCLYNCPVNTIISCRNQISYNQFKSSPFQVSHCQPVVSSKMLCKDLLNATDLALVLILRWATFLPFCHVRRLVGRAAPPTSSVPSLMNPWAKSVHRIIDLKSRNIETSVVVPHTHMRSKIVYRYHTSETSRFCFIAFPMLDRLCSLTELKLSHGNKELEQRCKLSF